LDHAGLDGYWAGLTGEQKRGYMLHSDDGSDSPDPSPEATTNPAEGVGGEQGEDTPPTPVATATPSEGAPAAEQEQPPEATLSEIRCNCQALLHHESFISASGARCTNTRPAASREWDEGGAGGGDLPRVLAGPTGGDRPRQQLRVCM
jgi:hypothetical protein